MRSSVRAFVILSLVPAAVLLAGPARAAVPDTAYDAGAGLTVTETLGIFVGIPLLVMGVIYALVYGLTGRRGPRYPAGQQWTAEPVWFGDKPTGPGQVEAGPAERPLPVEADGEGGARGQW